LENFLDFIFSGWQSECIANEKKCEEMTNFPSEFEHSANSINEVKALLHGLGVEVAILKVLPKNANDKNQIYLASDFGVLYDLFDLSFAERGGSSSETKRRFSSTDSILEAVFNSFQWIARDGRAVAARKVKAIIYPQYPEARLSGLQSVENTMPQSLSVAYTKAFPEAKRLLVLGKLPLGKCVGLVYLGYGEKFEAELAALPGFERARACKRLDIQQTNSSKLEAKLKTVLGKRFDGCRMGTLGQKLAFSGTQVCGYTLEHALGIIPNSDSNGDLYGIELKTHTQAKVTLFTPEPDGGLYAKDFGEFMRTYGRADKDGNLRVTGIHRAGVMCSQSQLTLMVRELRKSDGTMVSYDPNTPLTPKVDGVDVALLDSAGNTAASWSLGRLMNCWGAKHNEVVYIPAIKSENPNTEARLAGHEYEISFSSTVMWCNNTSAERLLKAIQDGVIFLDPAPKLHRTSPSQNKRRAQWRVNDIAKAASALYQTVEFKTIV
jgi:hypothetical protein